MDRRSGSSRFFGIASLLVILSALLLRSGRLLWQPLWWDEGYSVYFATESILTMLRLTAQDIHPPLYYALLHGWLLLWGNASPLVLRTFSILIGVLAIPAMGWLARQFFPGRRSVVLLAMLLLALSPMHLFYSQEVRMYGLELLLGILSTGFFWQMMGSRREPSDPIEHATRPTVLYVFATTALLYVEYYAVLLPLIQFLWALWTFRAERRLLLRLFVADLAVALLYLPWLLYTVPQLTTYIAQKIVADADRPLGLFSYLWRYFQTFLGGHIVANAPWIGWLQFTGLIVTVLFLLSGIGAWISARQSVRVLPRAFSLLLSLLILSLAIGFVLNLRLPFFPEGGERVLFFILPYFLLLLAVGIDILFRQQRIWAVASAGGGLIGLLLVAAMGIWSFYTVPRYVDDDYRSLIRQTVQQGSDNDTVFAVFPWQVGYWRAYAPVWGRGDLRGPWPILSPSAAWGESVAAALEGALDRGKLWFPGHRTLGGLLEDEIEAYLAERALLFENRWRTATTRLSGWTQPALVEMQSVDSEVDFGPVRLRAESAVSTSPVTSANDILPVSLGWILDEPDALPLKISLRLLDMEGRIWANREFQWDRGDLRFQESGMPVGLLIPVGLPPQPYRVVVGVGPAQEGRLLPVQTAEGPADVLPLATIQVVSPVEQLSPVRLSIQQPLADPILREGVAFLGFSGYDPEVPTLAGTEVGLSVFLQNRSHSLPSSQIYVSLLDHNGNGVAGWEGWPLADYPTTMWAEGALVRLPIDFYLPANLEPDRYTLAVGLTDLSSGQRSTPVRLGVLPVTRRQVRLDAPQPEFPMTPVQIGTHARLFGYDLAEDGATLRLTLYWEVLQTLLPPHQVFVHLSTPDGDLLDQDDGVPGERAIAAPSGTWLPGEIIVDPHVLAPPADLPADAVIRVGLYVPQTGVRLPILVDEQAIGDAIVLPLDPQ